MTTQKNGTRANKTNQPETVEVMQLVISVTDRTKKDAPAIKSFKFDNDSKLTKQIAAFLDVQEKASEIKIGETVFNLSGKTATNKADRTQMFLRGLLQSQFAGSENASIVKENWITKNLATSFKVAAMSFNAFKVSIDLVFGAVKDVMKIQKLETLTMNKPLVDLRVKTQAELKQAVLNYRNAFPLQLEGAKA